MSWVTFVTTSFRWVGGVVVVFLNLILIYFYVVIDQISQLQMRIHSLEEELNDIKAFVAGLTSDTE